MRKSILYLTFCAALSGCASPQYVVKFDSTPQGASLVCGGKNYGYTPVVLHYNTQDIEAKKINIGHCKAIWSSGVTRQYPDKLNTYQSGSTIVTLPRPKADGYAQDAEFELKVKNLKAQQKIADAAQLQAENNRKKLTSLSFEHRVECKQVAVSLNPAIKTFAGHTCPYGWRPTH